MLGVVGSVDVAVGLKEAGRRRSDATVSIITGCVRCTVALLPPGAPFPLAGAAANFAPVGPFPWAGAAAICAPVCPFPLVGGAAANGGGPLSRLRPSELGSSNAESVGKGRTP